MDITFTGTIDPIYNPRKIPKNGESIVVQKKANCNIYIGIALLDKTIINKFSKNTKIIQLVSLLNEEDYDDDKKEILELFPQISKTSGLLLLKKGYGWRYVSNEKLAKTFEANGTKQLTEIIQQKYKNLFENNIPNMTNNIELKQDPLCHIDNGDEFEYMDESFQTTKEEMDKLIKNPPIEPTGNRLTEQDVNLLKQNEIAQKVREILDEHEKTPKNKLIISESVGLNSLITEDLVEKAEAKNIIEWVDKKIKKYATKYAGFELFQDLSMIHFNGYVYFVRKNINPQDILTENLVKLNHFKDQYGKPIDYDLLRDKLFQTDLENKINGDKRQEVEDMFKQEFLIALQPDPFYMAWILKRILVMWYVDPEFALYVRQIKVLINQWRGKNNKEYNRQHGILPSIVIYPRYGKVPAKKVLDKLVARFYPYQNIGWRCSTPSYFVKVNDLIYYTNGSIELKYYLHRMLKEYDGNVGNLSLRDNLTKFVGAYNLLHDKRSNTL